jgi:hypothetical protein
VLVEHVEQAVRESPEEELWASAALHNFTESNRPKRVEAAEADGTHQGRDQAEGENQVGLGQLSVVCLPRDAGRLGVIELVVVVHRGLAAEAGWLRLHLGATSNVKSGGEEQGGTVWDEC